jgi:hypothetical protein
LTGALQMLQVLQRELHLLVTENVNISGGPGLQSPRPREPIPQDPEGYLDEPQLLNTNF